MLLAFVPARRSVPFKPYCGKPAWWNMLISMSLR